MKILLEMLADGSLHLSGIAKLLPLLTETNRETLLARAAHQIETEESKSWSPSFHLSRMFQRRCVSYHERREKDIGNGGTNSVRPELGQISWDLSNNVHEVEIAHVSTGSCSSQSCGGDASIAGKVQN